MDNILKELIEAIRGLTSALNNSSWLVDYFIPILSVFLAAGATLLGSYWLKKREFRSLDSIERKNKIYIPLATIMFKILESTTTRPIPIIMNENSPYIDEPDSLNLSELKEFVERPALYNIPSEVFSPLYNLVTNIHEYILIFEEAVEKAYRIVSCHFTKGIEKLRELNDKDILIDLLLYDLDQLKKNKLNIFYSYMLSEGGYLSFIKSNTSEDFTVFIWSSEEINELKNEADFNKFMNKIKESKSTPETKRMYTAAHAMFEFTKMDKQICDELNQYLSKSKLYSIFSKVCSVKELASIIEGKIYKIKNHHIQ